MSDVGYNEIGTEEVGQRLDNYLIRLLKGVPKSHIYRIIRAGEVRINKKRTKAQARLLQGDIVRIPPIRYTEKQTVSVSEKFEKQLKDSILFEDNDLLIINKPTGIAVHGGSGLSLGMIEALRKIRTDLAYLELVHRLDKETSGCLLVAKKRSVLRAIQHLLATRNVVKTYWALLHHSWSGDTIELVDAALEKNTLKSGERIVSTCAHGKPSQTLFKIIENYSEACWVEAIPKTGRTHQIRVHSAFVLNQPILGDKKYGKRDLLSNLDIDTTRLYLHARSIQFTLNGNLYQYKANLDERFKKTLKQLRANSIYIHR